jgi:Xaa-Pro dipeptidase
MAHKAVYTERLKKVVDSINKAEIDALLLNRLSHIAYLTGAVNSCSWVFITGKGEHVALVLDSDADVYKDESVISDIRAFREHDPFHLFKSVTVELGLTHSKIGLELGRPGLAQHTLTIIRHAFPPTVQFVNGQMLLEESRTIKSKEEVEAIKKAAKIAELGMETAIKTIKPGIRETDVIIEAEYAMAKAGGRTGSVNYLASGKRSSMAHQIPSQKKIENGDLVVLDIHGAFSGYCADLARTIVCGQFDRDVEQGYSFCIKAEEETINLCRRGEKMTEIRKTFYKKMSEAKNLKFTTGPVLHGVGIMNYEMPYFSFPHNEKGYPEVLEANMVVAVSNIGLYSKNGWGVRVEDTAMVTDNEPVYLTDFTKELLII